MKKRFKINIETRTDILASILAEAVTFWVEDYKSKGLDNNYDAHMELLRCLQNDTNEIIRGIRDEPDS